MTKIRYDQMESTTAVIPNLNSDMLDGKHAVDFATAAQGTKADNALPASSYTATDVLAKTKTVDGTGSGLDADLLDGKHAPAGAIVGTSDSQTLTNKTITDLRMNGVPKIIGTGAGDASTAWLEFHEANGTTRRGYIGDDAGDSAFALVSEIGDLQLSAPSGKLVTINGGKVYHSGNDGTGSGLDADLLDGLHATSLIQKPLKVASAADLNTITTPGLYYSPANADACINVPESNQAFSLLVEQHAGIKQTWTKYLSSAPVAIYVRNYYQSWGPWEQVIMETGPTATASAKGLMASADKSKLDGIATSANNYVHPSTHPPSIIAQDASNRFVTDSEKTTWSGKANNVLATPSANGLMSASDKSKLDGMSGSGGGEGGTPYDTVSVTIPAGTTAGWKRFATAVITNGMASAEFRIITTNASGTEGSEPYWENEATFIATITPLYAQGNITVLSNTSGGMWIGAVRIMGLQEEFPPDGTLAYLEFDLEGLYGDTTLPIRIDMINSSGWTLNADPLTPGSVPANYDTLQITLSGENSLSTTGNFEARGIYENNNRVVTQSSGAKTYYVNYSSGSDSIDQVGDSSNPFKTVNYALSKIPKMITATNTIYIVGSYPSTMKIEGFFGPGGIVITGSGTDVSVGTSSQTIYISSCSCEVTIKDLACNTMSYNDGKGTTYYDFIFITNCNMVNINSCSSTASSDPEAYVEVYDGSTVLVTSCIIDRANAAIRSRQGSHVNSSSNTGTGNNVGLYVYGGTIMKDGTQAGASTAESKLGGGQIW